MLQKLKMYLFSVRPSVLLLPTYFEKKCTYIHEHIFYLLSTDLQTLFASLLSAVPHINEPLCQSQRKTLVRSKSEVLCLLLGFKIKNDIQAYRSMVGDQRIDGKCRTTVFHPQDTFTDLQHVDLKTLIVYHIGFVTNCFFPHTHENICPQTERDLDHGNNIGIVQFLP